MWCSYKEVLNQFQERNMVHRATKIKMKASFCSSLKINANFPLFRRTTENILSLQICWNLGPRLISHEKMSEKCICRGSFPVHIQHLKFHFNLQNCHHWMMLIPPKGKVSTDRCTTASFITMDPLDVSDWNIFCTFLTFVKTYKLKVEKLFLYMLFVILINLRGFGLELMNLIASWGPATVMMGKMGPNSSSFIRESSSLTPVTTVGAM